VRRDFYAVLGVSPTASAEEIRQAYRTQARECHPDARPGDPSAAAQFKIINEAYRVLGTPQLRRAYDSALAMLQASPSDYRAPTEAAGAAGRWQTSEQRISHPPAQQSRASDPGDHMPTTASGETAMPMSVNAASQGTTLTLGVTPGEPSIVAPRGLTRFYLLSELGSAREPALLDPLPLDLVLLIDRSNSMVGDKLFEAKEAVRSMLGRLSPDDLLTVIFFDDHIETIADGITHAERASVEMALEHIFTRGSTQLATGLETALRLLSKRQPDHVRIPSLVLLTDGQTFGDERACLQQAVEARQRGVSITALGLGADWNRDLLDRLAAISGGSSNFIEQPRATRALFEMCVSRLRATLAADMRLTFTPAQGVGIVRATRVAPEIAEAFSLPPSGRDLVDATNEAITVDLGALVGRPDVESAVVVWEMLFDPEVFFPVHGAYTLGRLSATYWSPRQAGGRRERLEREITLPVNTTGQHGEPASDVRLALELITAFRLQTVADEQAASGNAAEAITHLNTSALRLRSAGEHEMADATERAAQTLMSGAFDRGRSATLRVKYDTKNLSLYHRLRRKLAMRQR